MKYDCITLLLQLLELLRVVATGHFDWLVDSPLMKAEWRSASMECGGQCVTLVGITVMPELCADNWGSLWVCLVQVLKTRLLVSTTYIHYHVTFFSGNSTLWLSAQLWTRDWPSIPI